MSTASEGHRDPNLCPEVRADLLALQMKARENARQLTVVLPRGLLTSQAADAGEAGTTVEAAPWTHGGLHGRRPCHDGEACCSARYFLSEVTVR